MFRLKEIVNGRKTTFGEYSRIEDAHNALVIRWEDKWNADCDEKRSYIEYTDHDGYAKLTEYSGEIIAEWFIEELGGMEEPSAIYKRTSTHYSRNTKNCKWVADSVKVDYLGERSMQNMTGRDGVKSFNCFGWARAGYVSGTRNRYFKAISPSKLEKVHDVFEPVFIPRSAIGRRECIALAYARDNMRCKSSVAVGGHDLLVIGYEAADGYEYTVTYDLESKEFIG